MAPKSSSAVPKTVLDKVEHAVRQMADPTGSSRQAIVKFLKREYDVDNANAIKKALKTGVDGGRLIQKGQSFNVKGLEFKPPADEQVTIEEVKEGKGAPAQAGSEAGEGWNVSFISSCTYLFKASPPSLTLWLLVVSPRLSSPTVQFYSYLNPGFRLSYTHQ